MHEDDHCHCVSTLPEITTSMNTCASKAFRLLGRQKKDYNDCEFVVECSEVVQSYLFQFLRYFFDMQKLHALK